MTVSQNESWQLLCGRCEPVLWNICGITPVSQVTVTCVLTVLLMVKKLIRFSHRSWFTGEDRGVNRFNYVETVLHW